MEEVIGLPVWKLLENTLLNLVVGQTKTRELPLLDRKPNIISPYSNTKSCNSSPGKHGGCNIFLNSANKKIFSVFSVYMICYKERQWQEEKDVLPLFVSVKPCCFPCSMDMLVFHACSNQKPFHKKILFSRYIISQSFGEPQPCQLINQRSRTNIYIRARTIRTAYD